MDETADIPGEDLKEMPPVPELQDGTAAENVKRTAKTVNLTNSRLLAPIGTTRKRTEPTKGQESSSNPVKSTIAKPTVSSKSRSLNSAPPTRRNSTGGLPEKLPLSTTKPASTVTSVAAKKTSSSSSDPLRRSLPEVRRSSLSSTLAKTPTRTTSDTKKPGSISTVALTPRTLPNADATKQDSVL